MAFKSLEFGEENVGDSHNVLKSRDVRHNSIQNRLDRKNFPEPGGAVFSRAPSSDMVQMSANENPNDKSHSDDMDDGYDVGQERDRPIIDPDQIEMSLCKDDEYSPRVPDKNEKAMFKKKAFL